MNDEILTLCIQAGVMVGILVSTLKQWNINRKEIEMDKSNWMQRLQMTIVSGIMMLASWLIYQHEQSLEFAIAAGAIGLMSLVHWIWWPEVVRKKPCVFLHLDTNIGDAKTGLYLNPGEKMLHTFDEMVRFYNEVVECCGIGTPQGPDIFYASFIHMGVGASRGFYMPMNESIYINTDHTDRTCDLDEETLKHEMIHHLMHKAGMPEESFAHASNLFGKCAHMKKE